MIKIYDNFLPKHLENNIEQRLTASDFPWYYNDHTTGNYKQTMAISDNIKDYQQWIHLFYSYDNSESEFISFKNSEFTHIIDRLKDGIQSYMGWTSPHLYRIKANFQFPFPDNKPEYFNQPHCDFEDSEFITTAIYYVNDSDGDTLFFDNETELNIIDKVTPKKGRLVMFNSTTLHAGQHPIKSNRRIIINLNFMV